MGFVLHYSRCIGFVWVVYFSVIYIPVFLRPGCNHYSFASACCACLLMMFFFLFFFLCQSVPTLYVHTSNFGEALERAIGRKAPAMFLSLCVDVFFFCFFCGFPLGLLVNLVCMWLDGRFCKYIWRVSPYGHGTMGIPGQLSENKMHLGDIVYL